MTNIHGDVVSTMANTNSTSTALENYTDATEYGAAETRFPHLAGQQYSWLGAKQRSTDTVGGLTLMGARLYNPGTGTFLSRDSIDGANDNPYVYPTDPINNADTSGKRPYCGGGCGGDRDSPVAYAYNYNGTANHRKPGDRRYKPATTRTAGQAFTKAYNKPKKVKKVKKKSRSGINGFSDKVVHGVQKTAFSAAAGAASVPVGIFIGFFAGEMVEPAGGGLVGAPVGGALAFGAGAVAEWKGGYNLFDVPGFE